VGSNPIARSVKSLEAVAQFTGWQLPAFF
jgi:hypothetical protein